MGNSNTGRDKHVNESEVKSGELRDNINPNVKGEKAPNVRTDRMGTSEVPATRQKSISPKGKQENQDGDAT
ncbi:hypothetical protein [Cesiribacter sp. SM1]|uniref:hypothetical protein n=1 Tax=Cesiribacter sp. SM1 TaxID=2861196 RepID=UPI001CD73605|nr:hypothetical protein [Cesiribacter sp. SM1]